MPRQTPDGLGVDANFELPTDTAQLVTWLENKRKSGNKRMPDLQMKMNLAYVLGHQWIVWDRDKRQFRRPQWRPNDPNAPIRVTVNKMGGLVERTIARLLKEAPEPECRPVSDDEDDVGAAQAANRILESELDRLDWESYILINLYFWVTTLGWSYLHVSWDPTAGPNVGSYQADGAPDAVSVNQGDVTLEVVPAFELAVDPNARTFREAKWCVRTVSLTREACWEKFGVVPVSDMTGRTLVDEVYALTDKAREDRPYTDTVAVHQMWIKPGTRVAPKGMVVTWAGNSLLEVKPEYPYDHGELPFQQYDLLPGMGAREGRTWVTDLIPIQADYNDSRSREASIRRVLSPKLLYPTGSIDPQRVTSRVEMIGYVPTGNPPSLLMPDGRWMGQFQQNMERASGEMGERAGQGDVSSGNAPASMPAASVMALQEADDTKLAISSKLLAHGISQTGWQILMLVKQFWSEKRVVRAWSAEGDLEAQDFIGADVGSQLDVHVDAESKLPRSKAGRMNLAMELLQAGVFVNDPGQFLKFLDMPGLSWVLSAMSVDAKQAQRENAKLNEGMPVAVNMFDNDQAHIKEHSDYQKSEDYEKLTPPMKANVDAHVQAHQESIIRKTMPPTAPGVPPMGGAPAPGEPGEAPDAETPADEQAEAIRGTAGIGGPNEPGTVPNTPPDTQAARMGG